MMDEVPVKISELCRPPAKVHLPVSLRTLWSSDSSVPVMAFELENKALHWVQERRRNLVSERSARSERLQLRDQAKREKREQQARQRADDEQRRLRDEEEQLRREERERLEEFRRRREQQENAEAVPVGNETPNAVAMDPAAPVNHVCASAPAAAPSPPPVDDDAPSAAPKTNHSAEVETQPSSSEGVTSVRDTQIQMQPEGQDANGSVPASGPAVDPPPPVATETAVHPPPASQRPRENHSEAPAEPTPAPRPPAVVSSNPFNPFLGRMQTAVMTPQTWQHRQVGGLPGEQRSGNFNYRDFESQASDPFDSAELNTINDMAELESVFRPLPVTAASHSQPQQQPPRVDYTSAQHAQRPAGHVQRPRYYTPTAGPPAATAAMSTAAGGSGYRVPDGRPQYPGAGFIRPPTAYANALDNKPSGADLTSEYRYASGRASDYRIPSAVAAAGRPSSLAEASTSVAASLPSQPDARGLQEFYARYYGPPARLRSSRSEPDLSEPSVATADGGDARRTKSHTPPPAPTGAAAPSTDTVRDWQSSTQPDPLAGLEPSVRARLQELSQMGFPLDRLRRLHSHFNGDEKQVIELCLSAQRLEEAGHSPLSAERGLLECDGDVGRAADFLSSLAQLTGLGFPEPRAAEALRRSDMHRDRALDLLIQG